MVICGFSATRPVRYRAAASTGSVRAVGSARDHPLSVLEHGLQHRGLPAVLVTSRVDPQRSHPGDVVCGRTETRGAERRALVAWQGGGKGTDLPG